MRRDDIIFGRRPVLEMLEKGVRPDKILIQNGIDPTFNAKLRTLAKDLEVQIQVVPVQKLRSLTQGAHQGVIAFKAFVEYQQVQNVIQHLFDQGVEPLLLMLDRVTDVRNLGAIARSTEVFGAHAIVVPQSESAPVNGEAVKASAGALLNIAVCRERSLIAALEAMHNNGLTSYAAALDAENELQDLRITGPAVIVLGSEEQGIRPQLLDIVHHRFRIPQMGQTQSLNVSVAAGVALYQAMLARR